MTDLESDRQRTDPPQEYRSRVEEYEDKPDWPRPPLYRVNEVVYVRSSGQAQPAGPYIIISANLENKTYGLKKKNTGQILPTAVAERDLLVAA
ncbi:unnamed protein product [Fusarium graminearum]|uniref:Uncharacterized protein n=1 Tax=Gibberella zeae (strain ATCC MYA-4620 / CBS 123657 / FGSC 9075 / NRRL 31084 / PH-1) TaxID=229533 RepID=I1S1I5_GIBZE|nr:hypothetical protein FGSG_10589 [Fusarium graminearum PH-1]ESU17330.1 hypothetical protein FGSG_10589 [Fusarium graminearum PH-1]EYB33381.1 hypothetical protein FG05_10589 [Fusarium graminearum]CZS79329.1 unnamed protein product [Fusarium graminearum]|eukprot:XP_011319592.1 hypothetical protein FGSG_10589 [Fusarium graminearum PH-1]